MTQSQMGWQLNMKDVGQSISDALQHYIKKYGQPPQILLEVSNKLEEVPLPDGMNIVVQSLRVPKNILFVGEIHEKPQMGVPLETKSFKMDI